MEYEIKIGDYSIDGNLDSPLGKVLSFNAWALDGEMVGHYAAIPVI